MSTAFSVTVIYLTKKYAATARSAVRMLAALTFPALLAAQPATLPLHAPANSMLNRLDILGLTRGQVHPELRPLCREDAVAQARLADSIDNGHLSDLDRADIHYIYDDNNEWLLPGDSTRLRRSAKPVLGAFFRTPANFFEVNTTEFRLRANPMLHLAWGTEQSASDPIFFNQRGIEVRGDVDGRVFFSTSLLESQVRLPNYVQRWAADYLAVPGSGFFKPYQSTPFGIENGYDFNLAQAYVGFRLSQHIDLRFGHGQHFIGNGYRSLFLSDAGSPTYFLQVNTRVWRLHYQNLFLELSPVSAAMPRPPNSLLPKKYVAAHYLNLRVSDNAAIGFFEATVFNRSGQFEWQYLNPVVLYRSVEGALGSPDNVLIGLDARWDLFKRLRLYGQFLLDEFFVSEAFGSARGGWWGNKFGFQAGLKYINAFGVDHLDIQVEHNSVRPYTYSSFDSLNSYTHYNQPLAHPLWANFRETVLLARYQPHHRLVLAARLLHSQTGDDGPGENWGGNPLLGNATRQQDYGNTTAQGRRATTVLFGLNATWQWRHNLFWEARLLLRNKASTDINRDLDTRLVSLGLRWNVWNANHDF